MHDPTLDDLKHPIVNTKTGSIYFKSMLKMLTLNCHKVLKFVSMGEHQYFCGVSHFHVFFSSFASNQLTLSVVELLRSSKLQPIITAMTSKPSQKVREKLCRSLLNGPKPTNLTRQRPRHISKCYFSCFPPYYTCKRVKLISHRGGWLKNF